MVTAADGTARLWTAAVRGAIEPGGEAHKIAFCRMLLDTHNPYKPSVIEWPRLDDEARSRLASLPIWDIAVQTEGKAKARVLSYAEETADPLLREAIALNGFEEGRHKEVLSKLVAAYGIRLAPEEYVKAGEFDYVRDVPVGAFRGGNVTVEFALDKALPPGGVERRELGVVANTIGFEAK